MLSFAIVWQALFLCSDLSAWSDDETTTLARFARGAVDFPPVIPPVLQTVSLSLSTTAYDMLPNETGTQPSQRFIALPQLRFSMRLPFGDTYFAQSTAWIGGLPPLNITEGGLSTNQYGFSFVPTISNDWFEFYVPFGVQKSRTSAKGKIISDDPDVEAKGLSFVAFGGPGVKFASGIYVQVLSFKKNTDITLNFPDGKSDLYTDNTDRKLPQMVDVGWTTLSGFNVSLGAVYLQDKKLIPRGFLQITSRL